MSIRSKAKGERLKIFIFSFVFLPQTHAETRRQRKILGSLAASTISCPLWVVNYDLEVGGWLGLWPSLRHAPAHPPD